MAASRPIRISFIVFLPLLHVEEDWRGARDWAACQRDLAAKGEIMLTKNRADDELVY